MIFRPLSASLSLEASPYTIIRVGVMRTKLLNASDYHQLLHMSTPEILQKLQESDYAAEISAYALSATRLEHLDDMLTHNLVRTMAKLRRICDEHSIVVLNAFAMRNDLWNLKTMLRAIHAQIPLEEARRRILPTGILEEREWDALITAATSIESLLDALEKNPHEHLQRAAIELRKATEQQDVAQATWENALELSYFTLISEFIHTHGSTAVGFDEYFTEEIDTNNIATLFKLVREHLPPDQILTYLFPLTHRNDAIPLSFWQEACHATSINELFKRFSKTRYANAIAKGSKRHEATGSLVGLETELQKNLLRYSDTLMHRHPLSIDVILGFLLAKSTELRNLNSIVRGKQLGMDINEIEEFLIIRE